MTDNVVDNSAAAYRALLGEPIDLWIFCNGDWHHIAAGTEESRAETCVPEGFIPSAALPSEPGVIRGPVVEERSPGIFLVGTPLALLPSPDLPAGVQGVAWGTVRTSPQALVTALLEVSNAKSILEREVAELRTGVNPHLEQISYDFEELIFLRRLGEQTDLRDVSSPLVDLAQRILDELCPLIRATGLVFVATDCSDTTSESSMLNVGKPVAWSGNRILNDKQCEDLIDLLRVDSSMGDTVVENHMARQPRFQRLQGLDSCIQIPVVQRGKCFGWLVALNRIPWHAHSTQNADTVPDNVADDEFGTVEASLISSAAGTLAAHYRNSELFRERELLLIGVVRALINAIDAKDSYTCGHSDRVAAIAKCIGIQMGLDREECERLYMSGLLHDLGKIGIPDHVLTKPGKLTDEEFAIIQQHPKIGHAILNHLPQLRQVLPGVLHHHESFDGSGYPHGLSEHRIPLFARILAVADSYDAMTSARPYRGAMPTEKAEGILIAGAGTQWDSIVVQAFLDSLPSIHAATEMSETQWQALLGTADQTAGSDNSEPDTIARAITGFVDHQSQRGASTRSDVKPRADGLRSNS